MSIYISVGRYSYFKQRLLPISKIAIIAIIVIFIFKNFFFKCMITWTVNVVLGVYIGILVISTTTGHGGSVVSALASQAKGRGSNPRCDRSFFFPQVFFFLPFPNLSQTKQMNHQSVIDTPT